LPIRLLNADALKLCFGFYYLFFSAELLTKSQLSWQNLLWTSGISHFVNVGNLKILVLHFGIDRDKNRTLIIQ